MAVIISPTVTFATLGRYSLESKLEGHWFPQIVPRNIPYYSHGRLSVSWSTMEELIAFPFYRNTINDSLYKVSLGVVRVYHFPPSSGSVRDFLLTSAGFQIVREESPMNRNGANLSWELRKTTVSLVQHNNLKTITKKLGIRERHRNYINFNRSI